MGTIAEALDRARMLYRTGCWPQAQHLCQEVLEVEPRHLGAMLLMGLIAQQTGHGDWAVKQFKQVLQLDPSFVEAHFNLANAYQKLGKLDEAVAAYQQALALKPDYAEAYGNLGVTLLQQGKLDEAFRCFQQVVRLRPGDAQALSNLGVAYLQHRRLTEAAAAFKEALRLKPNLPELHSNLGMVLAEQGKLAEAEASYRKAVFYKPAFAGAYCDLGAILADQGKLTAAEASYQQALNLDPDYAEVHTNLAYACLLQGDFERGWNEYQWRWRCRNAWPPPSQQPFWDGASLQGKTIRLFAEQGLGDTLQFIRYVPLVRQTGASVIVQCPPLLHRLLASQSGIDCVMPEGPAAPECDVQAPLLDLPRIFRTTLATISAEIPYLSADPQLSCRWHERLSGTPGFKVGIAWQGNAAHKRDRERSVPLQTFAPLAGVSGVRLLSLQKGPGREQLSLDAAALGILDLTDELNDFADTAALLSNLDLVIAVDTAVVHLAGALGRPVWVALPFVPDWRWLLEREDSPWYPSMRLFRQSSPGDWSGVFERLTAALRRQVEAAQGESQQ